MLCVVSRFVSSCNLVCMPSMLICRRLSVSIDLMDVLGVFGGVWWGVGAWVGLGWWGVEGGVGVGVGWELGGAVGVGEGWVLGLWGLEWVWGL